MKLVLDPQKSRVRIHTYAEGLFARLAHDLELECAGLSGTADRTDDGGSATLEARISSIAVKGTLKDGHVDLGGLSAPDRSDCEQKMRADVFQLRPGEDGVVKIEAIHTARKARVRVVPPNGRAATIDAVVVRVDDREGSVTVSGTIALSLRAIGSATVKGPMNAFRLKDGVDVIFDAVFVDPPA